MGHGGAVTSTGFDAGGAGGGGAGGSVVRGAACCCSVGCSLLEDDVVSCSSSDAADEDGVGDRRRVARVGVVLGCGLLQRSQAALVVTNDRVMNPERQALELPMLSSVITVMAWRRPMATPIATSNAEASPSASSQGHQESRPCGGGFGGVHRTDIVEYGPN